MGQSIKRESFHEIEQLVLPMDEIDLLDEDVHEEKLLELQLTMATSSINHEYARIEFDEVDDYERREELMGYMHDCRSKYLEARSSLEDFNPLVLETFERDLILQKLATITNYHA